MVLGELRRSGDELTAYCIPTPDNPCRHSGAVDLDRAIMIFGEDFEVATDRARFVGQLVCSVCGRRSPDLRWHMAANLGYGLEGRPG